MHELSIAVSIVEMLEEEAQRRGGVRVNAVHLRLGALSGVVKDALLSSFDLACEGTPVAGCELRIEELPVIIHCAQCDARRTLTPMQSFCCPDCGTPSGDIVQGKELEISALEITELELQT